MQRGLSCSCSGCVNQFSNQQEPLKHPSMHPGGKSLSTSSGIPFPPQHAACCESQPYPPTSPHSLYKGLTCLKRVSESHPCIYAGKIRYHDISASPCLSVFLELGLLTTLSEDSLIHNLVLLPSSGLLRSAKILP